MQTLEIYIADLKTLAATMLNDPVASAIAGALLAALIFLILGIFLQRSNKRKLIRLEDGMDRKYQSLQETLSLKTRTITTLEQICQEQKDELSDAKEQIARFEESVKNKPVLEEKVEQQLRQIEALTDTIVSELDFNRSFAQRSESVRSANAAEPLTREAVIDHLGNRLYQQLSALHQQIADQSRLVTELQAELNAKRESVAGQIFSKSQQLPKIAKTQFDERVIEPIHMRVTGLKQTVLEIPEQTRAKIDHLLVDPINRKVSEIKTGLRRIPDHTLAQLNKIVLDPLNEFIHQINRTVKNSSEISQEKFNLLVAKPLRDLVSRLNAGDQSLSTENRETLTRLIVRPLEKLLAEIKQRLSALPELAGDRVNQTVIRPVMKKLQEFSESAKQASIKGIRNAGNWINESVTRSSTPAAAT